jgi:16S rRNA (cytosine967-C5)-methyltransferase
LRKTLLLAAYQLIGQERTSPAAVVSETVDQVRKREGHAPAKFVNASLRKISDHAASWRELPIDSASAASLPDWWWARLNAENPKSWVEAFAKASLERPQIWIRARDPLWKPEFTAKAGALPGSFLIEGGGAIPTREGFAEGQFIVQDISSQTLIAEISERVKRKNPNPSALDLCAAPGGKSIGLAWNGFTVTATDPVAPRLKLIEQNVARVFGGASSPVKIMAEVPRSELFDLVWVDAPCTGSGIIRRHPDGRWLKRESDVKTLASTQAELLIRAWKSVKPGGFLAYSVCSVFHQEGAAQLSQVPVPPLQTWSLAPHQDPFGDGFYAALFQK